MLGNEQNKKGPSSPIDEDLVREIDVSKPVKFDIALFFVSRYPSEKSANTIKRYINQYLRAIFPEVTNDTQRAITADSLVGKDNIETLCEFVFEDINLGKIYYPTKETSISSFYNHLKSNNKNIRNPIEYISLEKLYKEVRKIVQNNNNLDKDEVIKQVMKGIYGGKLDVCRYGKTTIYERNLYKRFVITDKFVSSRNGDVSKEERNEFEEWLKPKELDLSETDSYIDKYNEDNNNAMQTNESGQSSTSSLKRTHSSTNENDWSKKQRNIENDSTRVDTTKVQEGSQTSQNSQGTNLTLQPINNISMMTNNLDQASTYKSAVYNGKKAQKTILPLTDINSEERGERGNPIEFNIVNVFLSRYKSEASKKQRKNIIKAYLRAIFPEVTNDTQRAITADSLVGKDNIETLCEFVFEDINLEKIFHTTKETSISSFYKYLNSKNKNIRNPIEDISLEKLYKEVRKIVQNNNNLDKDEVIKQVMKGIYGGELDVCRYGETAIYERNLYKRFVITDKFVSSRNGDVSKEERNEFEEWLKPKELDLSKTDSYIDKYNEEKQLNNNAMVDTALDDWPERVKLLNVSENDQIAQDIQEVGNSMEGQIRNLTPEEQQGLQIGNQLLQNTGIPNTLNQGTHGIVDTTKVQEGTQTPQNSQENNLALQEITLEVPFLANNNLIQITAYKIPNTDVMFDCNNVQLIKDENGIIHDVKNCQLFLNNDGYLVTGNGYYPIPITHPVAAIIGKHGYTLGPLGDIKLPLRFAPNENAVHFLEGTYKQPILLCVDRNGIYDSLGNKIIVEKGQDGKIRITYPNEEAAYVKIQSMIEQQKSSNPLIAFSVSNPYINMPTNGFAIENGTGVPYPQTNNQGIGQYQNPIPYTTNQLVAADYTINGLTLMQTNLGNNGVFINGPVPTYYHQSLNGQGINPSAPIQTQQNNTNQSTQYYNPYGPSTSNGFAQHNNGRNIWRQN